MGRMMQAHIGAVGSLRLSLLMHIQISFKMIHTETPRSNVLSNIWAFLSPIKLTHKIYHFRKDPERQTMAIWKIVSFQQSLENIYEINIVIKVSSYLVDK